MLETILGDKGRAIENLFVSSFRMLGEQGNRDLIISRLLFSAIMHGLFLLALTRSFGMHGDGYFMLFLLIFIGYPYSFFYHIRQRARQVFVAYGKLTGRPNAYAESKAEIAQVKWDLRLFAIVELTLTNSETQENRYGGLLSFLITTALAALEGVFDVAENYLLPAIVIEKLSITHSAEKLKQLKQNVPAVLAGSFGLDMLGGVAASLFGIVNIGIIAFGIGLSFLSVPLLPADLVSTIPYQSQGSNEVHMLHIFLFPVFFASVFISYIHKVIRILTSSIKAIYFTIFYTMINHPDQITPEMKEKAVNYLKLQPV